MQFKLKEDFVGWSRQQLIAELDRRRLEIVYLKESLENYRWFLHPDRAKPAGLETHSANFHAWLERINRETDSETDGRAGS